VTDFFSRPMWGLQPSSNDEADDFSARCCADTNLTKLNLTAQEIRDEAGLPFVPQTVKNVEQQLVEARLDKEYLPIDGDPTFRAAVANWILGPDSRATKENRVASCQCLGGTGGLRLVAEFAKKWTPNAASTPVYVSTPCPAVHCRVFRAAGFSLIHNYRYWHPSGSLDFTGLMEDLQAAPTGSIVIIQTAAHSPTGLTLSHDQWREFASLAKERGFFVISHLTGNCEFSSTPKHEADVVQLLEEEALQFTIVQSFSLTSGLHSERIGCVLFLTNSPQEAVSVNGQLKAIARPMYSNPPSYGVRIMKTILSDAALRAEWLRELSTVAQRIRTRRETLSQALRSVGLEALADSVLRQEGSSAYLGLTADQLRAMEATHHVYLSPEGAVPLTLLTESTTDRLAQAVKSKTPADGHS